MKYFFDWDHLKAKQNIAKHKISFERAATVFKDPNALSLYDNEHSEYEDRWVTLGLDFNGILLIVIHTFQEIDVNNCNIRLISARKASKNEIINYRER